MMMMMMLMMMMMMMTCLFALVCISAERDASAVEETAATLQIHVDLSHVTCMSHVTRHTSPVTRHPTRVTRHTNTSRQSAACFASHFFDPVF